MTLLEYGDLECPYCGQAETVIRELLSDFGDLRYVWRHLPLNDVHPHAQLAAEASEAAGRPGQVLGDARPDARPPGPAHAARDHGPRRRSWGSTSSSFKEHLRKRKGAPRIAEDVESADMSGVSGTPSFFINGHRHQDAYDIDTLSKAVRLARARAAITHRPWHPPSERPHLPLRLLVRRSSRLRKALFARRRTVPGMTAKARDSHPGRDGACALGAVPVASASTDVSDRVQRELGRLRGRRLVLRHATSRACPGAGWRRPRSARAVDSGRYSVVLGRARWLRGFRARQPRLAR